MKDIYNGHDFIKINETNKHLIKRSSLYNENHLSHDFYLCKNCNNIISIIKNMTSLNWYYLGYNKQIIFWEIYRYYDNIHLDKPMLTCQEHLIKNIIE